MNLILKGIKTDWSYLEEDVDMNIWASEAETVIELDKNA
jgi:hypothetical protein